MKFVLFMALVIAPVFAADASVAEAIKSRQRAAALDLIGKKTDVNAAEADGSTALLWAASMDDTDLVARLLKAGANTKVRNQLGATPLSEAAFNSNTEILKALLDAGADANAAGA